MACRAWQKITPKTKHAAWSWIWMFHKGTCIPYARHYKPWLIFFFTQFSLQLRLILQTIYVLKTEILHFLSLKSAAYKRERLQIESGLWWREYGICLPPKILQDILSLIFTKKNENPEKLLVKLWEPKWINWSLLQIDFDPIVKCISCVTTCSKVISE